MLIMVFKLFITSFKKMKNKFAYVIAIFALVISFKKTKITFLF